MDSDNAARSSDKCPSDKNYREFEALIDIDSNAPTSVLRYALVIDPGGIGQTGKEMQQDAATYCEACAKPKDKDAEYGNAYLTLQEQAMVSGQYTTAHKIHHCRRAIDIAKVVT
ncbi:MAG: hypothetical protein NTAFB05_00380 [Nitrobacter sp.]|uniref:hypothetical protein n=1 Tax=Nitrobacter sp. TaxID=29420 RepID=UPI00387DF8E1